MSGFAWLGPVGELRGVPCPQAGVPVGVERPVDSFTGLSGKRTHFVGRRVYRSWSFGYVWSDPVLVDWLAQLASGGVVGPHYLYTSKAAQENLAPAVLQSGGSGAFMGRRVFTEDDSVFHEHKIPVKPSTTYGVSLLSENLATILIKTYTAAGTQLTTATVPTTPGDRKFVGLLTGGTAAYLTIRPTKGTGQYRVTEGTHTGFRTGDGVPQVIVRDPEQTLQRVMDGDVRADITVSIEETG